MFVRDEFGNTVGGPPWNLVLSYEHEIRREAVRETERKGTLFRDALLAAWKDPIIKERYFTTPLSLKRSRATSSSSANDNYQDQHKVARVDQDKGNTKGTGKGTGKGKTKGKGGSKDGNCKAKTPDGKLICYRFNNEAESCTKAKCNYLHVCGRCFKDHPLFRCNT